CCGAADAPGWNWSKRPFLAILLHIKKIVPDHTGGVQTGRCHSQQKKRQPTRRERGSCQRTQDYVRDGSEDIGQTHQLRVGTKLAHAGARMALTRSQGRWGGGWGSRR